MKIKLIQPSTNEPIGEVRLEDNKTVIDVKDEELKGKLEEFFKIPIEYKENLESEDGSVTASARKKAEPGTVKFFEKAVSELGKFNLKGELEYDSFKF
ncbi:MAG: hypothetical protein ABIH00_01995 [Armatimonadota bacterium]